MLKSSYNIFVWNSKKYSLRNFNLLLEFLKAWGSILKSPQTHLVLIPSFMIQSLISERKDRRDEAANEISEKWGTELSITGPILSIPYTFYIKDAKENIIQTIRYAHILPDDLTITGILYAGL